MEISTSVYMEISTSVYMEISTSVWLICNLFLHMYGNFYQCMINLQPSFYIYMEIAKVVSAATRVHETIWPRYKTKLFHLSKIQIPHCNSQQKANFTYLGKLWINTVNKYIFCMHYTALFNYV